MTRMSATDIDEKPEPVHDFPGAETWTFCQLEAVAEDMRRSTLERGECMDPRA